MAVSRDAALLLLTLRQPGPLSAHFLSLGPEALRLVRSWVASGLLQVRAEAVATGNARNEEFLEGVAALASLVVAEVAPADRLAAVSQHALLCALELAGELPARELGYWLYEANGLPWLAGVDAHGARRGLEETARFLDGPEPRRLGWSEGPEAAVFRPSAEAEQFTASWRSFVGAVPEARGSHDLTYKLYVSAPPRHLADCVREAAACGPDGGATHFKVGRDPVGVLRPDKLVLYFDSRPALMATAGALRDALSGLPAHGVPFTGAIDGEGLLSWGVDPPRAAAPEMPSWRFWVTQKAGTLLAGREASEETLERVLHRLVQAGVDVRTWAPQPAVFRRELGLS